MQKIKSLLVTFVISAIFMAGCNKMESEVDEDAASMFIIIEDHNSHRVLYHTKTKAMYWESRGYCNCGTLTLIVDENGKPLLWEG